jgi:ribosomal protein L37E
MPEKTLNETLNEYTNWIGVQMKHLEDIPYKCLKCGQESNSDIQNYKCPKCGYSPATGMLSEFLGSWFKENAPKVADILTKKP